MGNRVYTEFAMERIATSTIFTNIETGETLTHEEMTIEVNACDSTYVSKKESRIYLYSFDQTYSF